MHDFYQQQVSCVSSSVLECPGADVASVAIVYIMIS